jgi:hypothetical protein
LQQDSVYAYANIFYAQVRDPDSKDAIIRTCGRAAKSRLTNPQETGGYADGEEQITNAIVFVDRATASFQSFEIQ